MTNPAGTPTNDIRGAFAATLPNLLAKILPDRRTTDRFLRSAWIATQEVPDLLSCQPSTFVIAVAQAAVLGLEIGAARGLAYVLPFKRRAQLIVGYKGLLQLGRGAGILDWQGHAVREHDEFAYGYGGRPYLTHTPAPGDPEERGKLVAAYSVAWLHTDPSLPLNFRVLHGSEIERRRQAAQSNTESPMSPWVGWEEEMWVKTAMRAHANHLPSDERLSAAMELEDRHNLGGQARFHDLLDELPGGQPTDDATNRTGSPAREDLKRRITSRAGSLPSDPIPVPAKPGKQPVSPIDPDLALELERQKAMDAEGGV